MTVNKDLLRRTMTYIEEHPKEWDQDTWAAKTVCGTAFCFAGHAVRLAGHKIVFLPGDDTATHIADGRMIEDAAIEELGLRKYQADELFSGGNTLDELRSFVTEYINDDAE